MTIQDLKNAKYVYVPISIKDRLPELMQYVPTIDVDGELIVYRRTEHGWNMRDASSTNSPNDNKEIVSWLEKRHFSTDLQKFSFIKMLKQTLEIFKK